MITEARLMLPIWKPPRTFHIAWLEMSIEGTKHDEGMLDDYLYTSQLWGRPKKETEFHAISGEIAMFPSEKRRLVECYAMNDYGFNDVIVIPPGYEVVGVVKSMNPLADATVSLQPHGTFL